MSLLPIDPEDITNVAVNLKTGDISEYTDYLFKTMACIGGKCYGVGTNDVFELEGATDAGTDIDAAFLTGATDLPNTGQYGKPDDDFVEKALVSAYVGMQTFAKVGNLRLLTDQNIDRLYLYPHDLPTTEGFKNVRWHGLAKGIKGRWWQFGYENQDGSNFRISSILFKGARLKRRV